MDFSILLAMLGLGVAVVSLLPPRTKLSILFKINWLDKLIWFLALFLIHYVAFALVLFELGLLLPLGEWRYGFEPKSFTYLIFLLLTVFTTYRITSSKLNKQNIERFKDLSEELLFEKRFNELTPMLEKYLPELFHLSSQGNESARVLCSRLFTSKELAEFISVSKPNLGISIMSHSFATKERFVALFMEYLLHNQGSIFYYEMSTIQNTITRHRFEIPDSCKLSSFLFEDIRTSEDLGIW